MNALAVRAAPSPVVYWEGVRDSYTANARPFIRFYVDGGYQDPISCIHNYFLQLDRAGYRASTVRIRRLAALDRVRRILRNIPAEKATAARIALEDIARETPAPKLAAPSVGREKVLSLEDYRKVYAAAGSARQRAFIRFLYQTGARVGELVGIRLSDCTEVLDHVFVRVLGKGKKERTVRITAEQFREIREAFQGKVYLFETQGGRPYLRQYVSGQVAAVTKRAIGRRLSAHKLRHSFATRMLGRGVPVDAISRYLGHSDTAITLRFYSHNEMSDSQLFDEAI